MNKKRIKTIVAIAIIIVGLFVFLYPTISYIWNGYRDSRLITEYNHSVAEADEGKQTEILNKAKQYNEKIAARTTKNIIGPDEDYQDSDYESLLNFGTGIMGYIEIPKISAKIPQTWMLVLCYFTTFGGFMALTAWFPTFWKKGMGLDPMLAGGLTAMFSILAALLRVPGGKLSDRIGGEKVSMAALGLLAVTGVLMNIHMGWVGLFLVSLLISVAFGFNNGATMKLVPVYVNEGVGGANGWVGGLGAFGGFVFPPLMGRFADLSPDYGYGLGFLLFTGFAILVMVINYFGMIRKKH